MLFAGLYFGARTNAGERGKAALDASPAALRRVLLKVPRSTGFERLGPTGVELDTSGEVNGAYQGIVDVTSQVRGAGSGEYTVGDVQSATGKDRYAGWALVVAYAAPGDPPRNLTVFDGLQSVTKGKPAVTFPASGFQTPLGGPVRTALGFVAYEGDAGYDGDSASLNGALVHDTASAEKNFFNSGITEYGRLVADRTPDYADQLGFDAKLTRVDGVLGNGATSAQIGLRTTNEQYLPGVITFATDLYAPVITATKTVENLTHPAGPAEPGDTLRYTVVYANSGQEAARDFVASDVLPAGTAYLPGSLEIRPAGGSPLRPSDDVGDDLGEYEPRSRAVRLYLGAGAGPGRGGELAPATSAAISFQALVEGDVAADTLIENVAQAGFQAATLARALTAISTPAAVRVASKPGPPPPEADLELRQAETPSADPGGEQVSDTIVVSDHGPANATDVILHDIVPRDAVIESASTADGSCAIETDGVTCTIPQLAAGAQATVEIAEQLPAATLRAEQPDTPTVTARELDPAPGDNSTDVTPAALAAPGIPTTAPPVSTTPTPPPSAGGAQATVHLHDDATPSLLAPGQMAHYALTVTATSAGAAQDVRVCDRLPSGVAAISARGAERIGRELCWRIRTLTPRHSRILTITARLAGTLPANTVLRDAGRASATNVHTVRAHALITVLPPLSACDARVGGPGARIAC